MAVLALSTVLAAEAWHSDKMLGLARIDESPNSLSGNRMVAAAEMAAGRPDIAKPFLERVLFTQPNDIEALADLAETNYRLGNGPEAWRLAQKASNLDRANGKVLFVKAMIVLSYGKATDAASLLSMALRNDATIQDRVASLVRQVLDHRGRDSEIARHLDRVAGEAGNELLRDVLSQAAR
jgi:predicted Zn-dependent protease